MHKYYYSGTQLLAEEWSNHLIIFLYDASGAPLGMKYRTTSYESSTYDTYWYELDLQGDVVGIYGDNGTRYATYRYDAWGNQIVTYSNNGNSIVPIVNNPLRYRGYYYDADLGLYYLRSRYYDSNTGRFINADSALYEGLLGYNMYAYCENNPVMYIDPSGESLEGALLAWKLGTVVATGLGALGVAILVGVAVVATVDIIKNAVDDSQNDSKTEEAPKSVPESNQELDEKGHPVVKPGQQPTEKDGYQAPKNGPKWNKEKRGWEDKHGNVWVPVPTGTKGAHPSGHWDVQSPRGGYINVFPGGGRVSGGESPYPHLPLLNK